MPTALAPRRPTELWDNRPPLPRSPVAASRRPPAGMDFEPAREAARPPRDRPPGPGPSRGRPKPKTRRPPEVLTDAEARALIAACGGPSRVATRHRAMLVLLYRAGLRLSEALSLRPHDVDLDAGTVRVRFGKGGYDRPAAFDAGAASLIAEWMAVRRALPVPPGSPLLCSASGKMVTTAYIRRLMPRLARKAGIDKRVHAHGLRHTHTAQLRAEGVDVGIISKQLGNRREVLQHRGRQ